VKDTGLSRGVAKEDHSEPGIPLEHGAQSRADANGDRTANSRHSAQESGRSIDQVHRAAAGAGAAIGAAEHLGEHGLQIAALGEVVAMGAVTAVEEVRIGERRAAWFEDGVCHQSRRR